MLILIILLSILTGLFGLAFHITGALLAAAVWVLIRLPAALMVALLGVCCCLTLLLIPLGLKLFHLAGRILQ